MSPGGKEWEEEKKEKHVISRKQRITSFDEVGKSYKIHVVKK